MPKIRQVIDDSDVPYTNHNNGGGAPRSQFIQKLINKAHLLKPGKSLPVECESKNEARSLSTNLRRYTKTGILKGFVVYQRELICYLSRVEED